MAKKEPEPVNNTTIKFKRKDIVALYVKAEALKKKIESAESAWLSSAKKDEPFPISFRFKYALARLGNSMSPEIEALRVIEKEMQDILKPASEERNKFMMENGTIGPDGQKGISINDKKMIDRLEVLNKQLKEKYTELYAKFDEKEKEYKSMQEDDVELSLYKIKIEHFPSVIVDVDFIELLYRLGAIIGELEDLEE